MLEFRNTLTGRPIERLPNVDVHEENGEIVLKAEVPGLLMEDVEVSIGHGDLPFEADPTRIVSRVDHEIMEIRIPIPPVPVTEEWLVPEEIAY